MVFDASTAMRVDGKVAFVTGGTRGIGRGIAEAFVHAGAAVCVTARKTEELEETVESLQAMGGTVTAHQGSAGTVEVAEEGISHCVETLGACDILVNNAATNPFFGALVEAEPEMVRKTWQVNQEGPLWYTQAAWRHWMSRYGGSIVNVASIGGLRIGPYLGAYNISKAALVHMTRQLAMELAPTVRVNAVAPAVVKTHFARALWEPDEAAAVRQHPLGRLGTPDDVAGAVLYLASDAAAWVTGEIAVIDGGASL